MRLTMAGVSGAFGGVVGAPADMVNVRMQNDVKLPIDSDQRRNYKHAIDGLIRIIREEGVMKVILRLHDDIHLCNFFSNWSLKMKLILLFYRHSVVQNGQPQGRYFCVLDSYASMVSTSKIQSNRFIN